MQSLLTVEKGDVGHKYRIKFDLAYIILICWINQFNRWYNFHSFSFLYLWLWHEGNNFLKEKLCLQGLNNSTCQQRFLQNISEVEKSSGDLHFQESIFLWHFILCSNSIKRAQFIAHLSLQILSMLKPFKLRMGLNKPHLPMW